MKYLKLHDGNNIPYIGFGVWQNSDLSVCEESVYLAIKNGFRLIDTASAYLNEEAVGRAIKRAINDGICKRKDLFITTKLFCNQYHNAYKGIKVALKKLDLDYIDLMLLHQPYNDIFSAYRDMMKAQKEGLIKSIGISNFSKSQFVNLSNSLGNTPVINQIEVNPYYHREDDVEFYKSKNVIVEAWSPLATGKNNIFNNEILKTIANKHNASIAQIITKWLVDRNIIPLIKSTSEEHIKEYFDIERIKLDNDDLVLIKQVNTNQSVYFSHDDPKIVEWLLSWKVNLNE
ncbi:MAG: aldo/keto reductase [Mycoplasma sp.]|nr:aldo/keto reductase [Mycoplasma sp.]